MNGFFFINKPNQWTSRDVCNKISSLLHEKKVGHTGTLDPFATGLLIVTVNKATKAGAFLDGLDKEYLATLKLGAKTNTGDLTGEVIEEKLVPNLKKEEVIEVLNSFLGDSLQLPPMVSAIHHDGEKLYELARAGIEVERKHRPIHIKEIELIDFDNNEITFRAVVSTGTYIRTLGEDIADKLGTVGHLKTLKRTKIGEFNVENAISIEEVNESLLNDVCDVLSKILPIYSLNEKETKDVLYGNELILKNHHEKRVFLVNEDKTVYAVYGKIDNHKYTSIRGLW